MPNIILGSGQLAGGYEVANSLRFDDGSSDYLSRTTSTPTSDKIGTYSFWFKRSHLGTTQNIFNNYIDASNYAFLRFDGSADRLEFFSLNGADDLSLRTARVFRDTSAWYHIVFRVDMTQSTSSNRLKFYVNGVEETSFTSTNYGVQNEVPSLFEASASGNNRIGTDETSSYHIDGYMAEAVYCDGQSLDPTSFGEFDEDTGIWKPIDVSGLTFGTNGFYLDFENSGSLGADVSGNGNNFTVNNLTSIDQTTDTCTNNYCTMLSHTLGSYATISEGNLKLVGNTASDSGNSLSSFAFSSGKWYWEMKVSEDTTSVNYPQFFVFKTTDSKYGLQNLNGGDGNPAYLPTHVLGMSMSDGYFSGTSFTSGTTGASSNGDIIQFFFDMDNGAFYGGRNGTLFNSANPTSGSSKTGALVTWTPDGREYAISSTNFNNSIIEFNFGNPTFSISSGNSDGNGYGNFEYDPQGYYALNTKNLAEYG